MIITFLGTGTSQGVPVIACPCEVCHSQDPHDKRLRTSALVTDCEGNNILVDIGPDFRAQMLTHDVRHLEAILITHAHRDHVGGIDDIRPLNWVQKRNMEVYANKQAIDSLQHDPSSKNECIKASPLIPKMLIVTSPKMSPIIRKHTTGKTHEFNFSLK